MKIYSIVASVSGSCFLRDSLIFLFRISLSVLASHPLVFTALSGLSSEILSEAAVNGTT